MSYHYQPEQIKPSRREAIHGRKKQPYQPVEAMGKAGLSETEARDLGIDEPDNVVSKFKPSPKKPILPSKILRHNSFDGSSSVNEAHEEFGNSLSRSLPINLPYYSHQNDMNTTSSSTSSTDFIAEESTDVNVDPEKNGNYIFIPIVLCCIGILYMYWPIWKSKDEHYNVFEFFNDMDNLGMNYQISRDSILKVQTGIKSIYEQEDTGSFVFIYNSNVENFENKKLDQILDDISSSAAKFLRNDSLPIKHLVVTESDFFMTTHNELINQYRSIVERKGVMLVKDVDNVPSTLAMAFHYYCDEYNPLVKKSAIFFGLDLAKCSDRIEHETMHTKIENCLSRKWSGLPEDIRRPLLTRVVNVVVDLTSVF